MSNHDIAIEEHNIRFNLNEDDKTASVIKVRGNDIIPTSVEYKFQKYLVTSISEGAFKNSPCLNVRFLQNSKLRKIEKNSFSFSNITSLTIPPSVEELEPGWNFGTKYLNRVTIMPNNNNFSLYNEQFLLGKSSPKKKYFNVLLFSVRNVKTAKIPNFIEIIGSYAFENCKQLKTVEFTTDSDVQIFDMCAFSCSSIECMNIPLHLTKIGQRCFSFCQNLKRIEILSISELKIIEDDAFYETKIESILIPSGLTKLSDTWCHNAECLKSIKLMPNNKNYSLYENKFIIGKSSPEKANFDALVTAFHDITTVVIPSFIQVINKFAFNGCKLLKKVDFESNSKIQVIEQSAFLGTPIESFTIPSNLIDFKIGWCNNAKKLNNIKITSDDNLFFYKNQIILRRSSPDKDNFNTIFFAVRNIKKVKIHNFIEKIEPYAFDGCDEIQTVEISPNSKLESFEKNSFSDCSIKKITIPSSVKKIGENSFLLCVELKKVEIPIDSKLEIIEKDAFFFSSIESFTITPRVTTIGQYAFANCELREVEFSMISNLQIIEEGAFQSNISLKSIIIPSQVQKIGKKAFDSCIELSRFEFPTNPDYKIIEKELLSFTRITSISIPPQVTKICEDAFSFCSHLKIIEISDNSKLRIIDMSPFEKCNSLLMIPAKLNIEFG